MERRMGKIQARLSEGNDLFTITLRDTPQGVRLEWEIKKEQKAWRELREGAYMLRTNLQADSTQQLWSEYMQLTEAEASFRALKSELHIRPLFHQKESRVKAHVLVAFLGYALWVTLKHSLKRPPTIVPQSSVSGGDNAQPFSPMKALALFVHTAKRRHCPADHGWARDPHSPHYRTHGGTEIPASPARSKSSGTAEISFKM